MRYLLLFTSLLLFSTAKAQDKEKLQESNVAFDYVGQMPEAGFDLLKYVIANFHYPDTLFVSRIVVKFIVNEDGTISNIHVLDGKQVEKEIIDLVAHMPKWKPGVHNGKFVKVWYTLPLTIEPEY